MRDYLHEPDWEHLEYRFERSCRSVGRMERHLSDPDFVGDADWIGQLLQSAGWAVGYGWALGRPVDDLRELLRPAITGLHAGLEAGIDPDARRAAYPLLVSIIAGDRAAARHVARLRMAIPVSAPPNDTVDQSELVLAALALDRPDEARAHADIVTAHLDRLATPPDVAEAMDGLDRMARAILDRDQVSLERAAAERATTIARTSNGSVEARRDLHAVFDFPGVALCRFAHVAGLHLPEQPVYAADLVRSL